MWSLQLPNASPISLLPDKCCFWDYALHANLHLYFQKFDLRQYSSLRESIYHYSRIAEEFLFPKLIFALKKRNPANVIYPVVTIELISISAALMTNQPLVKAYLSEQGRYWTTTNQENDVWIKVNTPKAFLLNQRDLRKRMLIPTQREKKYPFCTSISKQ